MLRTVPIEGFDLSHVGSLWHGLECWVAELFDPLFRRLAFEDFSAAEYFQPRLLVSQRGGAGVSSGRNVNL